MVLWDDFNYVRGLVGSTAIMLLLPQLIASSHGICFCVMWLFEWQQVIEGYCGVVQVLECVVS